MMIKLIIIILFFNKLILFANVKTNKKNTELTSINAIVEEIDKRKYEDAINYFLKQKDKGDLKFYDIIHYNSQNKYKKVIIYGKKYLNYEFKGIRVKDILNIKNQLISKKNKNLFWQIEYLYILIGNSYFKLKEYNNTIIYFNTLKKFVSEEKTKIDIYKRLGNSYEMIENYINAIFYYKKAFNLDCQCKEILLKNSEMYFQLGEYKKAITELESYVKNNGKYIREYPVYEGIMEAELILYKGIKIETRKKFLSLKVNDMMFYDLLDIFDNILQGKKSHISSFIEKYTNRNLRRWDFSILEKLSENETNIKTKDKLIKTLNIIKEKFVINAK